VEVEKSSIREVTPDRSLPREVTRPRLVVRGKKMVRGGKTKRKKRWARRGGGLVKGELHGRIRAAESHAGERHGQLLIPPHGLLARRARDGCGALRSHVGQRQAVGVDNRRCAVESGVDGL